MTTALLLIITLISCLAAIARPWIGVIAYYTLALLSPDGFWPWIFNNSRISLYVAIATILGLTFSILKKEINFSNIKNKQTTALILLALVVNTSHFLSPYYGVYVGQIIPPGEALVIFNKLLIFYFISILLIDDNKKLMYLVSVLIVTAIIYTIWSNNIYFSGNLWATSDNGRLKGVGRYLDENVFSVLFVSAIPFIYFYTSILKNKFLKYSVLLMVPLAWHSLFLIGSRGALIALLVTTLVIAFRSHSKIFGSVVLFGLLVAVVNYGGTIYERSTNTVNTAQTDSEEPLNPRIITWTAGLEMIKDRPLLGVGIEQFQTAGIEYIDGRVLVAHNTFLQFATQAGLLAGFIYLWFFYNFFITFKFINKASIDPFNLCISNAMFISSIGYFICAIFLNLMITEMLYFLLIINITNLNQVNKEVLSNKDINI